MVTVEKTQKNDQIKREWDKAEEWLKTVPDKRIRDANGGILPDSY